MKRLLLLLSLFALHASATDTAHYRYISEITLPEPTQGEELAQVLLTPEMFKVTQDNYADIRVINNATGQIVPSLVECYTEEQRKIRRVTEPLTLVSAGDTAGDQFRVTLQRSPPPAGQQQFPLLGLSVKTPLRDFERDIQVEASADGTTWTTLLEQARIFDVSSYADLRVTDIPLPPVTQRHIRLTFNKRDVQTSAATNVRTSADGTGAVSAIDRSFREEQRPFRVDKVDGWCEESYWVKDVRPLRTREIRPDGRYYGPGSFTQPSDGLPKNTGWTFFETDRIPLESLTIDSPERFVKVPYEFFMETTLADGTIYWKRIASGVLERVVFRDYLSEKMTITWSTTRATRYCLSQPDNAKPVLTFAEAQGPDYRVVFPYKKGDSVSLLLGNPGAKVENVHADQIKMLMRTITQPLLAEASPLAQNPAWRDQPESTLNMTYVLAAAIILTALVLGFALFSAMRRLPQNEG